KISLHAQIYTILVVAVVIYPLTHRYRLVGSMIVGVIAVLANAVAFATLLKDVAREEIKAGVVWALMASVCCALAVAPAFLLGEHPLSYLMALPCGLIYVLGMFLTRILRIDDFRRAINAYQERRERILRASMPPPPPPPEVPSTLPRMP